MTKEMEQEDRSQEIEQETGDRRQETGDRTADKSQEIEKYWSRSHALGDAGGGGEARR